MLWGNRYRIWLLGLGLLWLPCGSVSAQCTTINIYDPDGFHRGKSISVGLFSMEGGRVTANFGPLETPRQMLLESLKKNLEDTNYFASVTVIAADIESVTTDYVLQGEILGVEGGSRTRRILIGGVGSSGKMRINGQLLGPIQKSADGGETRNVVSDYECNAFDMGGWTGLGGNETAIRKNAKKTADSISKAVFRQAEKKLTRLLKKSEKNRDKKPIRGRSQQRNRKWREKQKWNVDDYEREIESFVVRSDREDGRGVDALWVTNAVYAAHKKLLPQLRQTAVLNSRDIKRGMLTEIERIERFRGEEVYVIALTFNVSVEAAPLLWESEKIRNSTFLSAENDPSIRIEPSHFLDRALRSYVVFRERKVLKGLSDFWAFHPTIAVFPTKTSDGTPLVKGDGERVRLSTVVDGRPVELTFDLDHLDLRAVDDLMLDPVPKAAEMTQRN